MPVVFPQFAGRGPLPKHGFVRERPWDVVSESDGTGPASFVVRLADDHETRELWPHAFGLQLVVRAQGDRLWMDLSVSNDGDRPFEFMAALHAYLRVGDPEHTTVEGLGGLAAQDNANDAAPTVLPVGPLRAVEQRDVAVLDVPGAVRMDDPVLGGITLRAVGFADRVIWNPGADAELADVPAGGESQFCCLEPAVLTPVSLDRGELWSGSVSLTAH